MPTDYPSLPHKLMAAGGGTEPTGESTYPSTPEKLQTTGGGASDFISQFLINRQELIKNYANMVARTWSDESYLQLLLANPVETLAQAGMPTIPGAVVRVVQMRLTGMGRIEEQVDKWIEGINTGLYDLWLPMKPEGIEIPAVGGGDINCCCTPCCCCT